MLTVTGTDLTLADRNPIRYRGYYYDTETQLYYLQSRYYDPELRRFISPDSYAQTYDSAVGANMFAYCNNRPTIAADDGGEWLNVIIGAVVGGAISALTTYAQTGDVKQAAIAGAVGAVSGAIAATGWCMITQAVSTAVVAGVGDYFSQKVEGKSTISWAKTIHNALLGGAMSLAGSALGEICTIGAKANGKELIKTGKDKLLTGFIKREVGQSHSALIRQGRSMIAAGTKQVNTAQGITSVVGTVLTWGFSFLHQAK